MRIYTDFNLEFYTEVQTPAFLVRAMGNDAWSARHRKLSAALAETVSDFGLVSFVPLAIQVCLLCMFGGKRGVFWDLWQQPAVPGAGRSRLPLPAADLPDGALEHIGWTPGVRCAAAALRSSASCHLDCHAVDPVFAPEYYQVI